MASTSRKRLSVPVEEIEKELLLEYDLEESASSESDSDEVIEDCSKLDVIREYSDLKRNRRKAFFGRECKIT